MGSALVIKGQVGLGTGGSRSQHYHHQPDLEYLGTFHTTVRLATFWYIHFQIISQSWYNVESALKSF